MLDPGFPPSGRTAPVKAKVHYTQEDDGLSLPWFGRVFLHPPYGQSLSRWTAKAKLEVEQANPQVVGALLPACPARAYWHRDVAGSASIFFLKGRLQLGNAEQSAPFPSCLVLWGSTDDLMTKLQAALPSMAHTVTCSLPFG
jgi:DNA N-6-adenine-methyltransferase (Dam)